MNLLFQKKESIKQKINEAEANDNLDELMNLEDDYEEVTEEIASVCAQRNRDIVKEYLEQGDDDEPHNQLKTWRLKKKLAPKNSEDPPTAKINKNGELVSDKSALEKLYLDTYVDRLQPNQTPEDLQDIVKLKNLLFGLRLNLSSKNTSREWTLSDLDKVLKSLTNNKARDAHGHAYELFKYGGRYLKLSLLRMCNLTKRMQLYPDIFQPSNISSIYKLKGRKDDLSNDRGVFNVVKLPTPGEAKAKAMPGRLYIHTK